MKATFAGLDGYFESLEPATERQQRLLDKAWDLARKYNDTVLGAIAAPVADAAAPARKARTAT